MKKVTLALVGLSLSSAALAGEPHFAVTCTEYKEHGKGKGLKTVYTSEMPAKNLTPGSAAGDMFLGSMQMHSRNGGSPGYTLTLKAKGNCATQNVVAFMQPETTYEEVVLPEPAQDQGQDQSQGKGPACKAPEKPAPREIITEYFGYEIASRMEPEAPCSPAQDQCQDQFQGKGKDQVIVPVVEACDASDVLATLSLGHRKARLGHSDSAVVHHDSAEATLLKIKHHPGKAGFAMKTSCSVKFMGN